MIIRRIKKEELLETKKLSSICFEYPYTEDTVNEDKALKKLLEDPVNKDDKYYTEKWGAFQENQEMMSCLSVVPFQFQYDGNWIKGTGIGNVCTYPHHRRKGAIKNIFLHILPDMYQDDVILSYLYPFSEGFYNRFGYQRVSNSKCWNLGLNTIPDYRYSGSFHLCTDPKNRADFESVYNEYASRFNLMVRREDFDWTNLDTAKAYLNNNYAYLYKDHAGIPRGYLIFKKEIRNNTSILNCRELIFDNFQTLKALMSFVRTYAADYKTFRFYAPSSYNLEYFCNDFMLGGHAVNDASNGMVRVIHVKKILQLTAYKNSGNIALKITDPLIPENNQIFFVTYQDGQDTIVQTKSHDSTDSIDVEMPIDIFSAAIIGNYDVEDFNYMDGIQIHSSKDKLKNIFYKKPNWINNYF